jgi:hypothetical protein
MMKPADAITTIRRESQSSKIRQTRRDCQGKIKENQNIRKEGDFLIWNVGEVS